MPFRYIFCLLFLFSCSGQEKADQAKKGTTVDTSVMQPPVALADENVPSTSSAVGSGIWQYARTVDKEGRTVYKASTISPELLEFDFPYNGGSTATLTIRKRESDTHVYIQVSKGQFNRSYQEGNARIRFDNNSPATYTFSAAETGVPTLSFSTRNRH